MTIGLVDTGCANLASVRFALERASIAYLVASAPSDAAECDRLILPGVGAAQPAMAQLERAGWAGVLRTDRRPLLGICLGMQLLFEHSAEGDVPCLGLIPGQVERLPQRETLVWPHMGWNTLDDIDEGEALLAGLKAGNHVYFVHGFYVPVSSVTRARTTYGAAVSAVVRYRHVAGCQFHPERSASAGARILQNFAELRA